jgi:hypothetical protein
MEYERTAGLGRKREENAKKIGEDKISHGTVTAMEVLTMLAAGDPVAVAAVSSVYPTEAENVCVVSIAPPR